MSAYAGMGTLLKMGDGTSPEVFTTIAQMKDINGPSLSLTTHETTTHDSTGSFKTFVAGLLESGEVSGELLFDAAAVTHKDASTGLLGVMKNRTLKNWKIVPAGYSPVQTFAFSGYLTKLDFKFPVDGIQSASFTIKTSGVPTLS
jgi:predicted secreted protein